MSASRAAVRLAHCACAVVVALPACKRAAEIRTPDKRDAAAARPLISDAGRLSIWNAEHRANVLKERGLSRLAAALAAHERPAVEAFFAATLEARVPTDSDHCGIRRGTTLSVERIRSDRPGGTATPMNRSQLADWLTSRLEALPSGDLKVAPHVIRLAPDDPHKPDGGWSGTGKLEAFVTTPEGIRAEATFHFEIGCDAVDEDSLEGGGWISRFAIASVALGRAERPLMREVAAESGFHTGFFWDNWKAPRERRITNTGGVYLTDFNRDGLHDIFVTDVRASLFYVGLPGGTFREITADIDIRGELGGGVAAFADLDGDGWEDLVHCITQHPDAYRIYRNMDGLSFADVSSRSNLPELLLGMNRAQFEAQRAANNPDTIQVAPTGLSIADYDLDGRLDLYVTRGAAGGFKAGSWIDGRADGRANNQLLRNAGDWQFEDVTQGAPLDGERRSTTNAVWLYADDDLRPDLYVIDEFGDGILLLNRQAGFEGRSLNEGPTDFGSMGMTAGDFDNDGHADIYIAEMFSKAGERVMANIPSDAYPPDVIRKLKRLVDGSQLYRGLGDGEFEPVGRALAVHAVGWAWGACFADLDNDGWLDLYATAGFISQERGKPDG